MKKYRNGLIVVAIVLVVIQLTKLDYGNLSWSNNEGSYLGVLSMIIMILSMIFSNRYEKKHSGDS